MNPATAIGTIRDAVTAKKKVVMSTLGKDKSEEPMTVPGCNVTLARNHAYVLEKIDTVNNVERAFFYNPWGYKHVNVALTDLKDFFDGYDIQ